MSRWYSKRFRESLCLTAALVGVFVASSASAQTAAGTAQFVSPQSPAATSLLASAASLPSDSIILDASADKKVFPLPGGTRSFATQAEVATFLSQTVNATPIYDASGTLIGASGTLVELGNTYYTDANTVLRPITNPIGAHLGGLDGHFMVAGSMYTTATQPPDVNPPTSALTTPPPPSVTHCNGSGECIRGESFKTDLIFYHSIGGEVTQTSGGYQESTSVCWLWGFIPYPCTTSTGSNQLALTVGFHIPGAVPGAPPILLQTQAESYLNVTGIKISKWGIFFGVDGVPVDEITRFTGVCSNDSSASIPSYGITAFGPTTCASGGVTCTGGTQLCEPNHVCTSVYSDVNNCGGCGNRCGTGGSCQYGTCVYPQPQPTPQPSPTPRPPPACKSGYRDCGDGFCVKPPMQCP